MDEATSVLHALVAKWQDGQRQKWLSPSVLSELQQKILLAEERWKRARARVNMGEKESKEFLTIFRYILIILLNVFVISTNVCFMTVFRDRLTQVQCRTPGIHLSDIRSISSSESSLASMEDALSEYDDHYESVLTQKKTIPLPMKCCHNNKVINCWECYAHQLPLPAVKNSNMDKGHEKPLVVDSTIEDCSLCPTTPTHKTGSSQFSKSSNYPSQFGYKCAPNGISIRGSSLTPLQQESCENHPENGHASGMNVLTKGTCKVLEVIVSSNRDVNKDQESVRHTDCIDVISKFTSQQKCLASSGKNELPPTRLFNSNNNKGTLTGVPCKETKASSLFGGNCKSDACILENRNDRGGDDDDDNDDRTPRHSKDYFKKNSVSIDQLLTTGAPENEGQSFNNHFDESRGEKNITRPVEFHEARCEFQVNDGTNNPSPDDCSFPQICTSRPNAGTLTSVEPDLIIGIKGIHNISCRSSEVCAGEIQLNSNETEPLISDNNTRNDNEQIADNQEFFLFAEGDGPNDDPVLMEGAEARSLLQLSEKSPPMIDFACMATSVNNSRCVGVKRRGFLHKLNIKWPSKVKVKNLKRVQEITPEDFRETYLHVRNNGGEDLLLDTCGDCMNELATLEDVPSSDLASSSICAADVDENTNSNEKLLQITDSKNSNMNSCEQSGDGEKREVPATTVPLPSSLIHNTSSFSALPNADLTNGVPNESKFQIHVLSRNIPVPPPPTDADFSGDAHHEIVKMLPSHSCLDKQDSYCFSIPKCTSLNQKRPVDGDGSEQSLVNSETYKAEADQVTASQRDTSLTDESSPVCRDVSLSSPHLTSQVTSHPNFISRPESSASRVENYSTYRFSAFSLHKMSLGITDIPTPGSLTPNRLSPAPSEASKTESALSPPSDISKTESMSQLKHLNRIKEIENQHSEPFTSLQLKQNANIKVSPIVNNELEAQKVQEQKSNVRITGGFVNTHYNTMAEDENSKTDVCLEKSASVSY